MAYDDDAPAEVNTSNVRKKKLTQVRDIRQRDRETKETEKDRRRKRDEMFKSQKEQKMLNFGKRALPQDVLEAVSTKNTKLDEGSDEGVESNDDEDRLSGSGSDDDTAALNINNDDDFISLDSTVQQKGLNVVTVEDPKKNKSSLENALAFKNNRLFHTAGVAPPRETANQRRNRMLKKEQLQLHG